MQYLFVINPTAGKADASVTLLPRIRSAAERAGITPTIVITRRGRARPPGCGRLCREWGRGTHLRLWRGWHAERDFAGRRRA